MHLCCIIMVCSFSKFIFFLYTKELNKKYKWGNHSYIFNIYIINLGEFRLGYTIVKFK